MENTITHLKTPFQQLSPTDGNVSEVFCATLYTIIHFYTHEYTHGNGYTHEYTQHLFLYTTQGKLKINTAGKCITFFAYKH